MRQLRRLRTLATYLVDLNMRAHLEGFTAVFGHAALPQVIFARQLSVAAAVLDDASVLCIGHSRSTLRI